MRYSSRVVRRSRRDIVVVRSLFCLCIDRDVFGVQTASFISLDVIVL